MKYYKVVLVLIQGRTEKEWYFTNPNPVTAHIEHTVKDCTEFMFTLHFKHTGGFVFSQTVNSELKTRLYLSSECFISYI